MRKKRLLAFGLTSLLAPSLFGFSSDGSLLSRSFDRTSVLTNSAIVVTADFTNAGNVSLRGFYYADQVPSGLSVATLGVLLNGRTNTDYTVEVGQDGDVYAGCTPYRWVLEQPTDFVPANPIPPGAGLQIVYSISSAAPGLYNLQQFSWVGFSPVATNASFGYSESTDQVAVSFLTAAPPCAVSGHCSTNGFLLQVDISPGCSYAIEVSTNLVGWVALATNTAPFVFTDTNAAALPTCFYRARWVP